MGFQAPLFGTSQTVCRNVDLQEYLQTLGVVDPWKWRFRRCVTVPDLAALGQTMAIPRHPKILTESRPIGLYDEVDALKHPLGPCHIW